MKTIKFSAMASVAALALGLSSCKDTATSFSDKYCELIEQATEALNNCKDKDDIRDTADELYDIALELKDLRIDRELAKGDIVKEEANRTQKEQKEIDEAIDDRRKDVVKAWDKARESIAKDDDLNQSAYLRNAMNAVRY